MLRSIHARRAVNKIAENHHGYISYATPHWWNLDEWLIRFWTGEVELGSPVGIAFSQENGASNKSVDIVRELPTLREVELHGKVFTDEGLLPLRRLEGLDKLRLIDTNVSPAGINRLGCLARVSFLQIIGLQGDVLQEVGECKHLERLDVSNSTDANLSFGQLATLPDLRQFTLRHAERVSNEEIAMIASAAKLEYLRLDCCEHVTDEGLASLGQLEKLLSLDLSLCSLHRNRMRAITGLPQLRELILISTDTDDDALEEVAKCRSLRCVGLHGIKVTDNGIRALSELRALEHLSLRGVPITDECISVILKFHSLRELRIDGTAITDEGVKQLVSLPNLEHVVVGHEISSDAIDTVRRALPRCEVFTN